jgi:ribosomal protein S18 acetylase RimI-like enzyme
MEQAALDVDTQNPSGALQLYEKLGFTAVKRRVTLHKQIN